ncbi:MAG: HAD-IA family hydrolase [Limimaricola sp.]|uniref:HAD family hydrolase n=1 Tax=Limimaricola sp. TaxID=2211665 RepID=UPI001D31EB4D|nr:HAD family hydrolase [Limimaricola sp.]MBI1415830.1 HAD-IA family hydrolase [Limimaricola sp.]
MPYPDLIIFDCDGVLVDSEVLSAEVLIGLLAEVGVNVDFAYVRRHFLGRSFPTVAKQIRTGLGADLPDGFEARYRAVLLDRFASELRPTPGVEQVLSRLAIPFCVATSSSPPRVTRSLEVTGLAPYFGPRVFTASQVAHGKPSPDLFLFAAAQMGAAPTRTLVIEDSAPGVAAAQAAGMQVAIYTGGAHLGGEAFDTGAPVRSFSEWARFDALTDSFAQDEPAQ